MLQGHMSMHRIRVNYFKNHQLSTVMEPPKKNLCTYIQQHLPTLNFGTIEIHPVLSLLVALLTRSIIAMELLGAPHLILRHAIIAGHTYPHFPAHTATFLARTLFHTSMLQLGSRAFRCGQADLLEWALAHVQCT